MFKFFNYLNVPVKVEYSQPQSSVKTVILEKIDVDESLGIPKIYLQNLIKKNGKLYITIVNNSGYKITKFQNYIITDPSNDFIQKGELHIGMISSRWVGANSDYNIGQPGLNAAQGLPYVRLHNNTGDILRLNHNIEILPGRFLRYNGRDNFGVRLGTKFESTGFGDCTQKLSVFPTFIMSIPATDIYFGIVSDKPQAKFGGFQLTDIYENNSPNEQEPQYLLEEGWMGGPSRSHIQNGFLPIESGTFLTGPPRANRWGQLVNKDVLGGNPLFVRNDPQMW